jgi:hypothetical protein
MIDCGSDHGDSVFETAGAALRHRKFQKRHNAKEDRKMPFLDDTNLLFTLFNNGHGK